MTSSADLSKWSWSNQVGAYQYYIHGSGAVTDYVNLGTSFKNPADAASKQGAKITIDETSRWNGQTMLRTELIPQTKAAINKGKVYYHFSVKTSTENKPTTANEHQVAFFESHFTELKYGGDAKNKLQWHVGGVSKWDTELVADEWHNVAYEIDFDGGSVSFWHSTGSDALKKTAGPFTASTQSNGADWHLGVLRLPGSNDAPGAEDWFFSGVYIEDGELTTKIGDGAAPAADKPAADKPAAAKPTPTPTTLMPVASPKPTTAAPSSSAAATSAAPVTSSSAAASPSPAAPAPAPEAEAPAPETPEAPETGSGSGSDATLPKEFTIKEFIAWLRAKQAQN